MGPISLMLKRASTHRPSGPWLDDDFDVYDGERHVGRIMVIRRRAGRSAADQMALVAQDRVVMTRCEA